MPAAPARKLDPAPEPSPRRLRAGATAETGGQVVAFDGGAGGGASGGVELPPGTLANLGIWIAIAPLLMFFLSIASAYVVRQGLGEGWGGFPVPSILWFNTLILLASSATMEVARRRCRTSARGISPWVWATLCLGIVFLAGQITAWRGLSAAGIDLGLTPYGSYLYLMTGAHAVHLAGGLLALLAAALWPSAGRLAAKRSTVVRTSAVYWHFMDFVWLMLFSLLAFWR